MPVSRVLVDRCDRDGWSRRRDVVAELAARGVPVTARDPSDVARRGADPPEGVTPVRFNLADPASWPGTLDGADGMFLLRPPQVTRVRRSLLPFVDAALAAGGHRVAFLSVQGAGRNALVPHHAVEQHLRHSVRGGVDFPAGRPGRRSLTATRWRSPPGAVGPPSWTPAMSRRRWRSR